MPFQIKVPPVSRESLSALLHQSARAEVAFEAIFTENLDSPQAQLQFEKSLQAFRESLIQLSSLEARWSPLDDWLLQARAWQNSHSPDWRWPASRLRHWKAWGELSAYRALLQSLKKHLNSWVARLAQSSTQKQEWQVLRRIQPRALPWEDYPVQWLGRKGAWGFLSGVLAVFFVSGAVYFGGSYQTPSFVILYPQASQLTPSPLELLIDEKASLQFPLLSDGSWQTLQVHLPQPQPLGRILLGFDLRVGRVLELQKVKFLGKHGEVLAEEDFQTPERERWTLFFLENTEEYRIQPERFDFLRKQGISEETLQALQSWERPLFSGKEALHTALKSLSPAPSWEQRAFVRDAFRLPRYHRTLLKRTPLILSPELPLASVATIEIVVQVSPRWLKAGLNLNN